MVGRGIPRSIAGIALMVAFGVAGAQTFPSKTVRVVVAFPPGGGTDIVARIVGQKLGDTYGHQLIVDNRAGAAGVIGTELAARSAPDGYTWFMATMGNVAVNRHLYKMAVDPVRDLAPVTNVVAVHFIMVAHPSLPAKNVKELIALAKARPGEITFSSSGAGGAPHLAGELLKSMAQIKLVHVPYKGSGPSFVDLLGGQIMLTCDSQVQALPYVRTGRLKALAVLSKQRSQQVPDVPTVNESGLPGYELTNWFGLLVPAATPRELVTRVNADVIKVLQQKDVRDRLAEMGADVIGDSPQHFAEFIGTETAKWAKVIKEGNIRAE